MKVTPETYVRAETDRQFGIVAKMAGGVNQLFHFRRPTPLDQQNIVRMNRDTLYSMAVVDTSKGATISVPAVPSGRYASVYLVDNDHYCPSVIYDSGTHELPRDTQYLGVGVRIQVFDPKDADEVARVNGLQDQFVIRANSADPWPAPEWDAASLKELTARYETESAQYESWKGMMGPRGKVDEKTRHIAAAAAWGLFPEWDATYLNYSGGHEPVQNADGSTDLFLGPKAPQGKEKNWLATVPGKRYFAVLRLYGPTEAALAKTWKPGDLAAMK